MGDKEDAVACIEAVLDMVPTDLSDNDKIRPDVVQNMRNHVKDALEGLK